LFSSLAFPFLGGHFLPPTFNLCFYRAYKSFYERGFDILLQGNFQGGGVFFQTIEVLATMKKMGSRPIFEQVLLEHNVIRSAYFKQVFSKHSVLRSAYLKQVLLKHSVLRLAYPKQVLLEHNVISLRVMLDVQKIGNLITGTME